MLEGSCAGRIYMCFVSRIRDALVNSGMSPCNTQASESVFPPWNGERSNRCQGPATIFLLVLCPSFDRCGDCDSYDLAACREGQWPGKPPLCIAPLAIPCDIMKVIGRINSDKPSVGLLTGLEIISWQVFYATNLC